VSDDAVVRVVLVDDHEMLLESLHRMLSEQPTIEVTARAQTAAQAVEACRTSPPDVVVMDYQLPDGDGIDTAQRILARHPEVKVVMLTAQNKESVLVRAIEAGCAGFVTKDKALAELLDAIRVVASGEAWIPPELVNRLLPRLKRTYRGVGADLTSREVEILRLAARGLTNAAIAAELHISVNTARNHVQNAITKLKAHSKLEAVAVAVREGIIEYPN
jgi:DNA-binding NarL/FixJ family response regulator